MKSIHESQVLILLSCVVSNCTIRATYTSLTSAEQVYKHHNLSLNDPSTQIWVSEASKIQIQNSQWMCQKSEPVIKGTVRKLVNRGTHLVCVFSTYIKRRSCYSSTKYATTVDLHRILFIYFRAPSYFDADS